MIRFPFISFMTANLIYANKLQFFYFYICTGIISVVLVIISGLFHGSFIGKKGSYISNVLQISFCNIQAQPLFLFI